MDNIEKRKRRRRRSRLERTRALLTLCTVLLLIASALAITIVCIGAGSQGANAAGASVDESAISSLEAAETQDVGSVIQEIRSRDAVYQSSVAESESIAESESESRAIAESIAAQSEYDESVAASQSEYEASVAAARYEADIAAVSAPLAGSHIIPGTVSYDLDDTDIPYIRKLFSNCIVIGNSRAKNAVDCGILTENEVKYLSGKPVNEATSFAVQNAYLYSPKTLFIFGLNDVASYNCDAAAFKADYISMIQQYLAVNPTGEIYCMESLPIPPEAEGYFYRAYYHLDSFNEAIQSMCAEYGWHYVSASQYADFSLINSEDHAHYGKTFYFLWAQTIAEQLHLYEDLAGLSYDINWEPY